MENNKKTVPEIRFPGFTDPWEQRKLCNLVSEIKRTDAKSNAPIMMITANDGFINQSERYSTENAGQSLKKYIVLKKGELAYNHGASKLRPYGSCFALKTEEEARIPFVYHCFSTSNCNPDFLSIVLNGKSTEKQLRKIVSSGARMDGLLNISYEDYTSIPIMIPNLDEQNKIAACFEVLDNAVTLHQRKCDELKNYKKGLLQQMFPQPGESFPRVRFPGFTDPWEQRKLEDVVEFLDTMRKPLESAKRVPGPYPYYGASGIVDYIDDYIFDEELVLLSEDGANITDRNYPVCFLAAGKYWVNNHAHVLRTKPGNENNFICNSLELKDYKQYNSGMAMPKLKQEVCRNLPINCPKFEEQKLIGDFFRAVDNAITLHQRKCDELKLYKKGLLQKMFV